MIIAQFSDPHIVARGKLFRGPIQGISPDAERVIREFDTAKYAWQLETVLLTARLTR